MWRLRAEQQLCVKPDKAEGASVVLLLTQNAVFAQAAAGGLHLMKFTRLLPVLLFWIIFPAFYNSFILIVQLKTDRKQDGGGGCYMQRRTTGQIQTYEKKNNNFVCFFLCFVLCAIYLRLIKPAADSFFILRSGWQSGTISLFFHVSILD